MRLQNFKRDNRPIIMPKLELFKEGFPYEFITIFLKERSRLFEISKSKPV